MWHYYKVPNNNGYQLEGHPQAMSKLAAYEITEEVYNAELAALKAHGEAVDQYTEQVTGGEIELSDVPEEYKVEVERNVKQAEIEKCVQNVKDGDIELLDVPEEYREEVESRLSADPELQAINAILEEVYRVDY